MVQVRKDGVWTKRTTMKGMRTNETLGAAWRCRLDDFLTDWMRGNREKKRTGNTQSPTGLTLVINSPPGCFLFQDFTFGFGFNKMIT